MIRHMRACASKRRPLRERAMFVRRQFLAFAALVSFAGSVGAGQWPQPYPSRPVRIVVGLAPGGGNDIFARLMGQWLSERLSQQFVIENRPGAGTNIATEAVVRAPPDGHTLLVIGASNTINMTLYAKLNFDFIRDIAPVAGIVRLPYLMLVNPSVPAKTVPEFIAYAKATPGKINMASPGIGTAPHLAGELFKTMAGLNLVHVPYRGGAPALTDLISGQVQVMFLSPAASIEYIRSSRLRALAVTSAARWEGLPDLPTLVDFVPGYESIAWLGIGAPQGTSTEIIRQLNIEINAGLADPKLKARFADLGSTPFPGTPADLGKVITEETEKWGKVIRAANIKPQ